MTSTPGDRISRACRGSLGPRGTPSAGSRCEQTSPNVSLSAALGCRKTWDPRANVNKLFSLLMTLLVYQLQGPYIQHFSFVGPVL
jgi:hypothetical protein